MPYAVWKVSEGVDRNGEKLPFFKGDKVKVDVTFINPALDRALENGDIDEWYYYTHCPSFKATAVDIDVQGTSSQGYPRRNYKTKFKEHQELSRTASQGKFKGGLAGSGEIETKDKEQTEQENTQE